MAEYLILIYEDEKTYADADPSVYAEKLAAHGRFAEHTVEHGGKLVCGQALRPVSRATTIRGNVVTHGPFAETKEALGGYYVIEATDLDHALTVAKLCPAPAGGVEVRPVMVFE